MGKGKNMKKYLCRDGLYLSGTYFISEDKFAGSDPKAGLTIQGTGFDWKKKDEDGGLNYMGDVRSNK